MIRLTRLNHGPFLVNQDLIEHVEVTPDTVIALTTGHTFLVLESPDQIVDRIIAFRRATYEHMCACPLLKRPDPGDEPACAIGDGI
jgi:flagellar protein FlbD